MWGPFPGDMEVVGGRQVDVNPPRRITPGEKSLARRLAALEISDYLPCHDVVGDLHGSATGAPGGDESSSAGG
jgi:hypothetical protein